MNPSHYPQPGDFSKSICEGFSNGGCQDENPAVLHDDAPVSLSVISNVSVEWIFLFHTLELP